MATNTDQSRGPSTPHRDDLTFHRAQSYPLSSSRGASTGITPTPELSPRKEERIDLEHGNDQARSPSEAGKDLIKRTPLYTTPLPGRHEKWHLEENLSIDWGALFYGKSLLTSTL